MIANYTCVHKQNKNTNKEAQSEYVFRVFDEKQTHDKMKSLEQQITRVERILLVSMGAVISGMAGVILVLLQKL